MCILDQFDESVTEANIVYKQLVSNENHEFAESHIDNLERIYKSQDTSEDSKERIKTILKCFYKYYYFELNRLLLDLDHINNRILKKIMNDILSTIDYINKRRLELNH